jgi:Pectate lyase superfamily protein
MTALSILPPYPTFNDVDGQPVEDGYIYIGVTNQNPEITKLPVFWDAQLTIPAAQPIRTSGGYPVRNGTPCSIYVSATDYSLTLRDKRSRIVLTSPSVQQRINGAIVSSVSANGVTFSHAVTYDQGSAGLALQTMQNVRNAPYNAVGNGIADDHDAIQAAHDALPADGGLIYLPSGVYSISKPIRVTKRNVRFVGANKFNTYIVCAAGFVGDAPFYLMGSFPEITCLTIYSQATGGYCIYQRGAGDMLIHNNVMLNGGAANTGYAMYMEDVDESLVFVPGAYRHRVFNNQIGLNLVDFTAAITTGYNCTGGGMNACVFAYNHIISTNPISLAKGGGNQLIANLFQSATGGNSGSRPFTAGLGKGAAFGGELHAIGNYFERYEYDFYPTSSSAVFTVEGHTSDASNNYYPALSGYARAASFTHGLGNGGEQLDIYPLAAISSDGVNIGSNYRAVNAQGNGAAHSAIGIDTTGARAGQMLTIYNNSWPLSFSGNTMDLAGWGSKLVLGQQGTSVNGIVTQGNSATFMFTASSRWMLLHVSKHAPADGGYAEYAFSGNDETMPTNDAVVNVTGNGVARTGALLAGGKTYGQKLIITGNSWGVTFAAGAASWSSAGAPTLGNSSTNCMSVQLVYTASGWQEVSRAVRP